MQNIFQYGNQIPINPGDTTNLSQDALKNTMQYELLNKFRTNNPLYDMFISFIVFSLVAMVMNKISDLTSWLLNQLSRLKNLVYRLLNKFYEYMLYRVFKYEKEEYLRKEVIIDYITDNKQINELYKAVYWYLSNTQLIDYVKETPIKYTYETKIDEFTKNEFNLNQILVYDRENKFQYGNYEVYYLYNKNLINIYTDQEKKKENYTIRLWTKYSMKLNEDVLNKFCQHCLTEYTNNLTKKKWQQYIYVNKNGKWEHQVSNNKRSIDTIILKNNLKDVIKNDIKSFLESEDWYNQRDIPYTRGYLFYGLPGCGKTSMIKAISKYCERHIHYLMLNNITSDNELIELLKSIDYKSTILVIEDIDCMTNIIQKREDKKEDLSDIKKELEELKNKLDKDKNKNNNNNNNNGDYGRYNTNRSSSNLTLSGLLNAIDGVFNNYGRILIMTTNHPEILDKALIRPGRIDKKIIFDNCDRKQIGDIYQVFFSLEADTEQLENITENKYSPAYITKLFLHYRDNPQDALPNIDKFNEDIEIKPLLEFKEESKKNNKIEQDNDDLNTSFQDLNKVYRSCSLRSFNQQNNKQGKKFFMSSDNDNYEESDYSISLDDSNTGATEWFEINSKNEQQNTKENNNMDSMYQQYKSSFMMNPSNTNYEETNFCVSSEEANPQSTEWFEVDTKNDKKYLMSNLIHSMRVSK